VLARVSSNALVEFGQSPAPPRTDGAPQLRGDRGRVARKLEGRGHLCAEDVRDICFPKPRIGKRGYDEDQVDALLDQIATTIATLDASS
jgi:DivIVA domain-containing protein